MTKKLSVLLVSALLSTLQSQISNAEPSTMVEHFEYSLRIVDQMSVQGAHYDDCKVASLTVDGLRYYRTVLTSFVLQYPLMASANIKRGAFSPDRFAYEDELPALIDGKITYVKYSTVYTLDPKTLRVLRSELKQTDSSGKVLTHVICQDDNLNS